MAGGAMTDALLISCKRDGIFVSCLENERNVTPECFQNNLAWQRRGIDDITEQWFILLALFLSIYYVTIDGFISTSLHFVGRNVLYCDLFYSLCLV